MNKELYLDNASTTPVYVEVVKAMNEVMLEDYGNPSSMHELGENALKLVNEVRLKIAREINASPEEIYFTSGASESNNIALRTLIDKRKDILVISSVEHPSVWEVASFMEKAGNKVIKIKVNEVGEIDYNELENVLKKFSKRIKLVSIMHVNNIIGTIQDLDEIGRLCKKYGVLFHTDAVQSFSKLKIDVKKSNISMLSASAHKIGGPKGIGFIYIKKGIEVLPWLYGGGQERGLRSGTENVPGIIGFGKALEIQRKIDKKKIEKIRDKLSLELEKIGGKINGSREKKIYNNIHVSFSEVDGRGLVVYLSEKGIYVSAGSACDSKKEKEDYVLKAIGLSKEEQRGSLRISLNENFKDADIKRVVSEIKKGIDLFR